jgi:hypothetical protein
MERFIDTAIEQFAHDYTEPETDLYARLREETYRTTERPEMQVGLIEGRFLQMLVRLIGARNILEIGMFTGYSTLMMGRRATSRRSSHHVRSRSKSRGDRATLFRAEPAWKQDHDPHGACLGNDQNLVRAVGSRFHPRRQGQLLKLLRSMFSVGETRRPDCRRQRFVEWQSHRPRR